MTTRVTAVIMAGGKGERLWPLVRRHRPKVCLSIDGRSTLLSATLDRVRGLSPQQHALVVITAAQEGPVRKALSRARATSVLCEPQGKNTAACIALAASLLAHRDPKQLMMVLPADHWIKPVAAFRRSLQAGLALAQASCRVVMIGVRPTRVHPGLGHLRLGASQGVRDSCRTFRVERFIEKPSAMMAARLLHDGRTLWNAGVFIAPAWLMLELIERWLPNHAARLAPLGALAGRPGFAARLASAYRTLEPVSFDQGVMAHVSDSLVVEGHYAWEDLGSWDSWARMSRQGVQSVGVKSRRVQAVGVHEDDAHVIAVVGLDDVIVAHTPDATLICRADQTQAVRTVVGRLAIDPRLRKFV